MKTNTKKYLAPTDGSFDLKNFSTTYNGHLDKETGKEELLKVKGSLYNLQEVLYAANSHSILILFQAMDAAGKDSAIEHVMSGINPQGCQVYSFKTPTSEEYEHDFLWRHYRALPERGRIGIHNRSHYENVLVCKVHPEYILNENIPNYDNIKKIDHKFWKNRYQNIINFEKQLTDNGTIVIKIFLHVSKDEQKKRFLERIDDSSKNWKFSAGDLKERALWSKYMEAYQDAIQKTSTPNSPWYVIPADEKWYTRLAVSQILAETMEDLKLKYPVLPDADIAQLEVLKQQLLAE